MVRDIFTLNTFEKRALLTLVSLCVCFAFFYIYSVQQTVMHVVERKTLEHNYEALNTHVSELAADYLALKEGVTQERATQLGFYNHNDALFVSSRPDTAVSLNVVR